MSEKLKQEHDRYRAAAHAMQTGVAAVMGFDPHETEPKHLRVGVNSAMVETATLTRLLIDKGLFTLEEYTEALANQMQEEAQSYADRLEKLTGKRVTLL